MNYKNIYDYPKNFLYSTVYLNKPWQIYLRDLEKPALPPKELEYKDCFKEKIFMINNEHKIYGVYPWSLYMVRSHGKMPPKELRYEGWLNDKCTIFDEGKSKEVTPDQL